MHNQEANTQIGPEQVWARLNEFFDKIEFTEEDGVKARFKEGEQVSIEQLREYNNAIKSIQNNEANAETRNYLREHPLQNQHNIQLDQANKDKLAAILTFLQQQIAAQARPTGMQGPRPRAAMARGQRMVPIYDYLNKKEDIDIKKDPATGDLYYTIKYGENDEAEEKIFIDKENNTLCTNSENPIVFEKMILELKAAGYTTINVDAATPESLRAIEKIAEKYDLKVNPTKLKKVGVQKQENTGKGLEGLSPDMLKQLGNTGPGRGPGR